MHSGAPECDGDESPRVHAMSRRDTWIVRESATSATWAPRTDLRRQTVTGAAFGDDHPYDGGSSRSMVPLPKTDEHGRTQGRSVSVRGMQAKGLLSSSLGFLNPSRQIVPEFDSSENPGKLVAFGNGQSMSL